MSIVSSWRPRSAPRPSSAPRRCCCTTTSTAGCGRPPSSTSPPRAATTACPTTDAGELGAWFRDAADSGSLERYLETFAHTVGVMQTAAALRRVAAECAEDLAADGVVYAEVRFAPELHVEEGLTLDEVVEAVLAGLRRGRRRGPPRTATGSGSARCSPRCGTPPARWRSPSWRCGYRDAGVVGFDIAGAEAGYPPTRHLDAFEYLQRENEHFTIHAGEAFGLPSIWQALQWCGADRLGHGVRIIDDIPSEDGRRTASRSAGWPRTCGTSGSRWSCARPPTCRPARPSRSPSTRSGCWPGCASGSPSTPTTG